MELVQIEADDRGAAQPGPEDEVHNRPIPQRPGMPVHGGCLLTAAVAAAGQPVEAFDPIQHVLEGRFLKRSRMDRHVCSSDRGVRRWIASSRS